MISGRPIDWCTGARGSSGRILLALERSSEWDEWIWRSSDGVCVSVEISSSTRSKQQPGEQRENSVCCTWRVTVHDPKVSKKLMDALSERNNVVGVTKANLKRRKRNGNYTLVSPLRSISKYSGAVITTMVDTISMKVIIHCSLCSASSYSRPLDSGQNIHS